MIIDLFAGPGGWDLGARWAGLETLGYELDRDACRTRAAAGFPTAQGNIATSHPFGRIEGLIASPPCQAFSLAGKQLGHDDLPRIFDTIRRYPQPWTTEGWADPRSALILEPLRWAWTLRPRWVACEQVKPCIGVWRVMGARLEELGYRWWAGVLNAADFGVPQTRERAIFMASLDFQPTAPDATHGRTPTANLFGPTVEPWVSMAEALGWGAGMTERHGDRPTRPSESPSPTLTGSALGAGAGAKFGLVVRTGANTTLGQGLELYERSCDEPAPTLDRKVGGAWRVHTNRAQLPDGTRQVRECAAPAPTAKSGGQWTVERPATTVCGDQRLGAPGHRDRAGGEPQFAADALRLSVSDALRLQSFPADFPVQGTKTAQFRQIGDAVPPLLAFHVLRALRAGSDQRPRGQYPPAFDSGHGPRE